MKKSELETGMVVKFEKGNHFAMVFDNNLVGRYTGNFHNFNEDLTCRRPNSSSWGHIVEVWNTPLSFSRYTQICNSVINFSDLRSFLSLSSYEKVWERTEETEQVCLVFKSDRFSLDAYKNKKELIVKDLDGLPDIKLPFDLFLSIRDRIVEPRITFKKSELKTGDVITLSSFFSYVVMVEPGFEHQMFRIVEGSEYTIKIPLSKYNDDLTSGTYNEPILILRDGNVLWEEKKESTLKLGDWDIVFNDRGHTLYIGCQSFDYKLIERIYMYNKSVFEDNK